MSKRVPLLFILILLLTAVVLAACSGQAEPDPIAPTEIDMAAQTNIIPTSSGTYTSITADGLAAMMEDEDFPLINVHIPYAGEIEGTDAFIPYNETELNVAKLPADKDATFAIYCRSGSMSAESARTLVEMGYTNVLNLDGGMNGWAVSGRPLIQN